MSASMNEIITIQIGGCGNWIGNEFWRIINDEHEIDATGISYDSDNDATKTMIKEKINVYYHETKENRYIPRCTLIDLDSNTIDEIKSGFFGKLFNADNYFNPSTNKSHDNWAASYYSNGYDIINDLINMIRKESESCDCLQGFQFIHALAGGTGSGLSSLLMEKLMDYFGDKLIYSVPIFPSKSCSESSAISTYNSILALNHLIECADGAIVIDNQCLHNICEKLLKMQNTTFDDLNWMISLTLSDITSTFRYQCDARGVNNNLRRLSMNLIPFPRLHFLGCHHVPFMRRGYDKDDENNTLLTEPELECAARDSRNNLSDYDPRHGHYFSVSSVFRGKLNAKAIMEQTLNISNKNSSYYIWWIPNNLKWTICDITSKGFKTSATNVTNSTAIQETFKNICNKYNKLLNNKTLSHLFTNEGMEESTIIDSDDNISEMILEYQEHQNYHPWDEEFEDEEYEEDSDENC